MVRPSFFGSIVVAAWILLDGIVEVLARDGLVGPDVGADADVPEIGISNGGAINLTMYHIHPLDFSGGNVTNRNLADLRGALYFDLAEIFQVFYCTDPLAPKTKASDFRCNNTEYTFDGEKTAVSEVIVEVTPYRNNLYGPYAMCNPCQEGGTSPLVPSRKCGEGEYVCDCFKRTLRPPFRTPTECTNPAVGRQRIVGVDEREPSRRPSAGDEGAGWSPQFYKTVCAEVRAAERTSGFWYSVLGIGRGVSWRAVRLVKRVTKACHARMFVGAVAELSRNFATTDPPDRRGVSLEGCVRDRCRRQHRHGRHPPAADDDDDPLPGSVTVCWVECLADATLGPNATYRDGYHGGGLDRSQLLAAWSRPFRSDDPEKGGCPDVSGARFNREPLSPRGGSGTRAFVASR